MNCGKEMEATERTFITWDGAELFYRRWMPDGPTDKALLLFHRGHEHSGRWQETVDSLKLDDVSIFAWDARGHGHSPGERGADVLGPEAGRLQALLQPLAGVVRQLVDGVAIAAEVPGDLVLGHPPQFRE